jgi:hypothetical protein
MAADVKDRIARWQHPLAGLTACRRSGRSSSRLVFPTASKKMLTQHLRDMEKDGLTFGQI